MLGSLKGTPQGAHSTHTAGLGLAGTHRTAGWHHHSLVRRVRRPAPFTAAAAPAAGVVDRPATKDDGKEEAPKTKKLSAAAALRAAMALEEAAAGGGSSAKAPAKPAAPKEAPKEAPAKAPEAKETKAEAKETKAEAKAPPPPPKEPAAAADKPKPAAEKADKEEKEAKKEDAAVKAAAPQEAAPKAAAPPPPPPPPPPPKAEAAPKPAAAAPAKEPAAAPKAPPPPPPPPAPKPAAAAADLKAAEAARAPPPPPPPPPAPKPAAAVVKEVAAAPKAPPPPPPAPKKEDTFSPQLVPIKTHAQLQQLVSKQADALTLDQFSAVLAKTIQLAEASRVAPAYSYLQQLTAVWLRLLPGASAAACAEVLAACARLPMRSEQVWTDTLAQVAKKHKDLKLGAASSLMHSLARIAAANAGSVPGMSGGDLRTTFAALWDKLLELSKGGSKEAAAGQLQDYSRALWACAKAGFQPEGQQLQELLSAAIQAPVLKTATQVDVHDMIWALGVLQHLPGWSSPPCGDFWKAALAQDKLKLAAKDTRQLPELLHALARLQLMGSLPAATASAAGTALIQSRTGRSAWAPRDVAIAMMACGVLGVGRGGFLAAAATEAGSWEKGVEASTLTRTVLALAAMRLPRQQLMEKLLKEAVELLPSMPEADRATHLACLVWAISASNSAALAPKMLDVVRAARLASVPASKLGPACMAHLGAAHQWMQQQKGQSGAGLLGPLNGEQVAACVAEYGKAKGAPVHPVVLLFERTSLKHASCRAVASS